MPIIDEFARYQRAVMIWMTCRGPVPGGTTRLAKVDDHANPLQPNKPSLDVVLSQGLPVSALLCSIPLHNFHSLFSSISERDVVQWPIC